MADAQVNCFALECRIISPHSIAFRREQQRGCPLRENILTKVVCNACNDRIELPVRNILQRNFLPGWNVVLMGILLSATPVAAQQASAPAGPASPQLIEDLVAANRILADQGILDGYGHVSVRHDRDPEPLSPLPVPGSGAGYGRGHHGVRPRQQSRGRPGRTSYRERSSMARSIRHGQTSKPLFTIIPRPSSRSARAPCRSSRFITWHHSLEEEIPIFEIRRTAGMTDLLVKTPHLGSVLAQTLGDRPAVLMRGHGTVVADCRFRTWSDAQSILC